MPTMRPDPGMERSVRKLAAQAHFSELWQRLAIEVAPVAIVVVDCDGLVVALNRALTEMLGYDADDLVGREVETLVPEGLRATHRSQRSGYARTSGGRRMGIGVDLHARRKDGAVVPVEVGLSPFEVNGFRLVIAVIAEISERKRLLAAVDLSERRHRWVLDHAPDGFYMADASGRLIEANLAYQRMSGYSGDELSGMSVSDLNAVDTPDEVRARLDAVVRAERGRFETWHRRKDGGSWPVEVTANVVPERGEVFVFVRDLSERRQAEAERDALHARIREFAFSDALTGLANRRLFIDRLAQALEAARRNASFGAVLFIDMDRFKILNDTRGHAAGDRFLVEVAARLREGARTQDTVARLGGDEFVVMLVGLDASADAAAADARAYAEKVCATLNRPYAFDDTLHTSSASIGVTLFPLPDDTVDAVLHRADRAMYRVKTRGGGGCRIEAEGLDGAAETDPRAAPASGSVDDAPRQD